MLVRLQVHISKTRASTDMPSDNDAFFANILSMFKAHFGSAAKAYWVYDGDLCPCCLMRPVDVMRYQGKEALSVNAFMYRDRGALIAYLLCGECAEHIMTHANSKPTSLHGAIEKNLAAAYLQHLNSLDA
jgi:hypothetical protein